LTSPLLIATERGGEDVRQILRRVQATHSETEAELPAVIVAELTQGIYRAKNDADRDRRRLFTGQLCAIC